MDPTYPSSPVYHEAPLEPAAPATWGERIEYARAGFYAGLAGGVLILVAAFVTALFLTAMATFAGGVPTWTWFDNDVRDGVVNDGWPEVPIFIAVWGLVTGAAVLLGALAVKERPDRATVPGVVMLAAGLLSFFALGGFFLGGLLAIVAGVLAVAGSRNVFGVRAPRVRDREFA
ncbi:MAG TPA: hypothetical protein VM370_05670 [Candidatus Thermoplasmatota archaeon]|nr:hypothetical protein [Candidatus Thermoplasmatota archaeon]